MGCNFIRRPNFFAAAVPICGGGDPEQAIYFKDVNIWAWHGEEDNVIDVKIPRHKSAH